MLGKTDGAAIRDSLFSMMPPLIVRMPGALALPLLTPTAEPRCGRVVPVFVALLPEMRPPLIVICAPAEPAIADI